MKKFKTLKWTCRTCGWRWEVLSMDINSIESEEECLSCQSYDTIQIISKIPKRIIN
jgi:hypothetical protein